MELGVRFTPKVSGYITGVRFYKSAASTEKDHEVSLWSASGELVASTSTYGETANGWQSARFHEPFFVNADEMYTVSYVTTEGKFTYTPDYFGSRVPTTEFIDAYSENGGDSPGVYKYSSTSSYPDTRFGTSNYWADVLFRPADDNPAQVPVDHSADANPDRCASYPSFPTASCTGVIAGTDLRICGGHIRVSNATYVDCFFPNGVNIHPTAKNIKIVNSRIHHGILGQSDEMVNPSLVLRDVEIDGLNQSDYGISNILGYSCMRCNVHSASIPIQGGQFHIEDSYIHDIYGVGDSHNEAVLPFSTINNTLLHNTIISNWSEGTLPREGGMSAAIALYSHSNFWSGVDNVLVEKNYIATNVAHYCMYGGYSNDPIDGVPSRVRIIDNVFGRCSVDGEKTGALVGWYRGNGNVWSNNRWAIDNSLIDEPGSSPYN